MAGFGWKLHGDGKSVAPGEVVRPDERLTWGRTVGLGAQHVVSMIGACFVAPILMGLDPNLAVMASGVATILFLLIYPELPGQQSVVHRCRGRHQGTGGDAAALTGALLVVGAVLFLC